MENVLYVLHHKHTAALASISKNLQSNYIILAQAYHINKIGEVSGELDKDIIDFGKQHSIKLMAMITNSNFNPVKVHQFLTNSNAQKKSLEAILNECNKNHLYGVQFDFEMVPLADKNLLTHYYDEAATLLHKNKFTVSFAVAPTVTDDNFSSYYQKKSYQIWQGAYDLKKLGAIADFITIMAYDQHAEGTIPGPTASILWVEQVIKHALRFIPADKLSLGIPTYSSLWYMGKSGERITMKYDAIDYELVNDIFHKYHPPELWDAVDQVHYTFYEINWLNRFVFLEDEKSFKPKVALAKKYNLKGISIFRLGIEDPKIWTLLP